MAMPRRGVLTIITVALLGICMPVAAASTVLRRGDVGLDVLLWQRMLNRMTIAEHHLSEQVIAEDGIFGPETERATKRFERGAEFPRDGVVTAKERRLWIGASVTCCGATKPMVGRGSYGTNVGHAQLELNKWLRRTGSQPLTIDLLFGPATEAATRSYQAANGLAVDGIVGPHTWGDFLGLPKQS
jgi:peptidoglycan hydrolase-like protein with peptidoglycan-binding domain